MAFGAGLRSPRAFASEQSRVLLLLLLLGGPRGVGGLLLRRGMAEGASARKRVTGLAREGGALGPRSSSTRHTTNRSTTRRDRSTTRRDVEVRCEGGTAIPGGVLPATNGAAAYPRCGVGIEGSSSRRTGCSVER
jgi:hypothetical protein